MSGDAASPRDLLDSDANVSERHGLSGGMGVSSERTGKVRGSGGLKTHGAEATGVADEPEDDPATT